MGIRELTGKALTGLVIGVCFSVGSLGFFYLFDQFSSEPPVPDRSLDGHMVQQADDLQLGAPVINAEMISSVRTPASARLVADVPIKNTGDRLYTMINLKVVLRYQGIQVNRCTGVHPYILLPGETATASVLCEDTALPLPDGFTLEPVLDWANYRETGPQASEAVQLLLSGKQ